MEYAKIFLTLAIGILMALAILAGRGSEQIGPDTASETEGDNS